MEGAARITEVRLAGGTEKEQETYPSEQIDHPPEFRDTPYQGSQMHRREQRDHAGVAGWCGHVLRLPDLIPHTTLPVV